MNTKFLWPLIAFLLLVGVFVVGLTKDPSRIPSPLVDNPAPEFSLPSLQDPNVEVRRQAVAVLSRIGPEAAAAVPAEMLRSTNLVGPAAHVKERIAAYQEAGVTHLQVTPVGDPTQTIEQLRDLIG